MLIDTHAHLNFKAFNKDLPDVIGRAKKKGVEKIIIPGAKTDSSHKAIEIAQRYDSCFAAVGIHPHHVNEFTKLGKATIGRELEKLIIYPDILRVRLKAESRSLPRSASWRTRGSRRSLSRSLSRDSNNIKKVVAIGEIGLDYYQYKDYPPVSQENKKQQKELLLLQLDLAQKENLPIIFHCRDAHDDLLEMIKQYGKSVKGVFHCFGGEEKHLQEVLKLGFYVGFDGNITYPENKNLKDLVRLTPLSQLLLETDSPYLTPIPFRGSRNEPSYITYIAKEVAEIHQRSIEEIGEITSRNALNLFKI